VNAFEVLLGAHRRGRRQEGRMVDVAKLLDRLEVLPLDRAGATHAAGVLSKLRASGDDLGLLDALVAGIALASGCDTIVTRDEGFRRVSGLRIQAY
jgi:predicted nucleic acid-binding protein